MTQVAAPSRLAVLLFTDIVGSTELKSRLGSPAYTRLLRRHNQLFEQLCPGFGCAEILKHTGDGYFAAFPTASDAVRFALLFQDAMRREPWQPQPLKTRIGIHIGEVAVMDMAGKKDVVGLAADVAARVMALGVDGQVLMTQEVFNDARQFIDVHPRADGQDTGDVPTLRWLAHGAYHFKGCDEALDLFEVGADGAAPLQAPANNEKATRQVPREQELTLGWRPAVGLEVPSRPAWKLQRKLGEGGFGEVWLAQHSSLKTLRVFKFCFDVERLRSFKRELTLFRLIREALGDRDDIAKLYDVQLECPPFLLESEYSAGGNLASWAEEQGGLDKVPLQQRLEILAQVADAVAAAHSVGVLHKDIKPANILIDKLPGGVVRPRISDFGIGILYTTTELEKRGITQKGFTQITVDNEYSRTGTRMYSPPETMTARPFTIQGDVYALGVLLYQMVVGDLARPLASGWERDVHDDVLRELIEECVDGHLERRLSSAAVLAERVRQLDEVREERLAAAEAAARAQKRRLQLRLAAASAAAFAVLAVVLTIWIYQVKEQERRLAEHRDRADNEAKKASAERDVAQEVLKFHRRMLSSATSDKSRGDKVTVLEVIEAAAKHYTSQREGFFADQPLTGAAICQMIGDSFRLLGRHAQAEEPLQAALHNRRENGADGADVARSMNDLGQLYHDQGRLADAEPLYRDALEVRNRSNVPTSDLVASYGALGLLLVDRADIDKDPAKLHEAEALLERALRLAQTGSNPYNLVGCHLNLSTVYRRLGKLPQADENSREALETCEMSGLGRLDLGTCQLERARCLVMQRRFEEAVPLYGEAIENLRAEVPDHRMLAEAEQELAKVIVEREKLAGAVETAQHREGPATVPAQSNGP